MYKTTLKKLFAKMTACAISIMMLASPLATVGFADSVSAVSDEKFADVTDTYPFKEQIELLADIGVILGTDSGKFSPDESVTREQMALFLFRLMLGRSTAGELNSTAFTDISDGTYSGAISWANAAGYILGTSATTFNPRGGITLSDAFTMIVRALGYSGGSAALDKGYPWTYIEAASKLGLDRGLESVAYNKTLTRGETAALLFNALTAEYRIAVTNSFGGVSYRTTSIIESVFGYKLGEASLIATNTLALEQNSTVIKTGYVSLLLADGSTISVRFSDLGLDGTPENWLLRSFKLIYSVNEKTGAIDVLGASYSGKSEVLTSGELDGSGSYVILGGEKYRVVEKKSDLLGTNANELIVYAHNGSGTLTQLKTTAELGAKLGFFSLEMIYDDGEETASRAILKPYNFGRLEIKDGKFNLANGLKIDEMSGGLYNLTGAVSGDYVLYNYNGANKRLEIAEKLTVISGALVTRLTEKTAVIGGVEYTLGNTAAGISADSVRAQLSVGSTANIIIRGGVILGTIENETIRESAEYLVLLTAPVPVYTDGTLKYVASANVNGNITNIFVHIDDIGLPINKLYRYKVQNGIYSLHGFEESDFAINGDIKLNGTTDENITLKMNKNAFYTLDGRSFVTDDASIVIIKNGADFEVKRGSYSGDILLREGAWYTAILADEIGSVETLRVLFVTDGALESSAVTEHAVKILAKLGTELIDGKIVYDYRVYSFGERKIISMHSAHDSLEVGKNYLISESGSISNESPKNLKTGIVTGFTASTITIGGDTYALDSGFKAIAISGSSVKEIGVSALYLANVEATVENGKITHAILGGAAGIEAELAEEGLAIFGNDATKASLAGLEAGDVELVAITLGGAEIDLSSAALSIGENGRILINGVSIPEHDAAEKLLVTVRIYGIGFTANVK